MSETKYCSIAIDFEVYQLLVLEKRGFDDSDNDVLRRLLGLNDRALPPPRPPESARPWVGKGVELPHGTKLRMRYFGEEHTGVVVDGKWKVEDEFYDTPSEAAVAKARTRQGAKTSLNGWKYWYVLRPSDKKWVLSDDLRNHGRKQGRR